MRVADYLSHSVPAKGDAWAAKAANQLDSCQQEVPVVVPLEQCLRREGLPNWSFAILVLDETCLVKVRKETWQRMPRYVLQVELPEHGMCIYSNLGKRFIKELQHRVLLGRAGSELWSEEYHQFATPPSLPIADDLHRFLMNNDPTAGEKEVLPTAPVPYLRWASGGILPIANFEGRDWVVLFFRDIEPIGWNVGNGASETLAEFDDLNELLTREFAEELMLVDRQPDYTVNAAPRTPVHQYSFHPVGIEHLNSDERFMEHLGEHAKLRRVDGIDFVLPEDHRYHRAVHAKETRFLVEVCWAGREGMTRSEDVLFSVNPAESGIEVIRPYSFKMHERR
jgi:hypothetical protein